MLHCMLALGWRARWIVDWTDHVWIEVWLPESEEARSGGSAADATTADDEVASAAADAEAPPARRRFAMPSLLHGAAGERRDGSRGRWVHLDPCEAALDTPKLYEEGWGKQLTFVVALGDGTISDVTAHYTVNVSAAVERRGVSGAQVARSMRWLSLRTGAPPRFKPSPSR
jgi:peptide-N4-(N-acetyl-beta-glucosaminyl)asparagine amidase